MNDRLTAKASYFVDAGMGCNSADGFEIVFACFVPPHACIMFARVWSLAPSCFARQHYQVGWTSRLGWEHHELTCRGLHVTMLLADVGMQVLDCAVL